MREVGIHRDQPAVAPAETEAESVAIRAADPHPAAALVHVDAAEPRAELGGQLRRAVGRAVVDHQHVGGGRVRADALAQLGEVLPLLVGREDDQDVTRAHGVR